MVWFSCIKSFFFLTHVTNFSLNFTHLSSLIISFSFYLPIHFLLPLFLFLFLISFHPFPSHVPLLFSISSSLFSPFFLLISNLSSHFPFTFTFFLFYFYFLSLLHCLSSPPFPLTSPFFLSFPLLFSYLISPSCSLPNSLFLFLSLLFSFPSLLPPPQIVLHLLLSPLTLLFFPPFSLSYLYSLIFYHLSLSLFLTFTFSLHFTCPFCFLSPLCFSSLFSS